MAVACCPAAEDVAIALVVVVVVRRINFRLIACLQNYKLFVNVVRIQFYD